MSTFIDIAIYSIGVLLGLSALAGVFVVVGVALADEAEVSEAR